VAQRETKGPRNYLIIPFLGQRAAVIGGWFLEAVILIGLFVVDLVTGKFLHHWKTADNNTDG